MITDAFINNISSITLAIMVVVTTLLYIIPHYHETAKNFIGNHGLVLLLLCLTTLIASEYILHSDINANNNLLQGLFNNDYIAKVEEIQRNSLFKDLLNSLDKVEDSIYVTSIRREGKNVTYGTPVFGNSGSDKPQSEEWFRKLPEWGNQEGHRLHRLLSTSIDKEGKVNNGWFNDECNNVLNTESYLLKYFKWDGEIEIPNIVIFDKKITYLILSSPHESGMETRILKISSKLFADLMINNYFEKLMRYSALPKDTRFCK